MLTLRLFILLILVAATASCQKTKTYKDNERRFEFAFPADWGLDTLTSNPRVMAATNSPFTRASFQILSEETKESIDKCFQTNVLDYFPQQVDSFKIVAQGRENINGHEAKWIEFQYQKSYRSRTALIYLTVHEGRLYQMEGLVASDDYPVFKDKFLEIVASVRLK